MAINTFKPIMVSFNEEGYNTAKEKADKKIQYLNYAKDWIHDALALNVKISMKKLSNNMCSYFDDLVVEFYKEVNQLGLSAHKLIEAKEINISKLKEIEKEYNSIDVKLSFEGSNPVVNIKRRDYETWTTTEKQNKKLLLGNELIASIDKMKKSEVAKVFPMDIVRGTSGFIRYDMRKNKFFIANEVIFA